MGGRYEHEELALVAKYLDREDKVMEVGTGIGLLSSYCAREIGSARVWTYEANPLLESYIRHVYKCNQVAPSLRMCILGAESGSREFFVGSDFWAGSTTKQDDNARGIIVPMISLAEELRRVQPTFLILDIEGGEYEFLKHADLTTVNKIVIEMHPQVLGPLFIEVKRMLQEAGFVDVFCAPNSIYRGVPARMALRTRFSFTETVLRMLFLKSAPV